MRNLEGRISNQTQIRIVFFLAVSLIICCILAIIRVTNDDSNLKK